MSLYRCHILLVYYQRDTSTDLASQYWTCKEVQVLRGYQTQGC